jgi:hypothetical protein
VLVAHDAADSSFCAPPVGGVLEIVHFVPVNDSTSVVVVELSVPDQPTEMHFPIFQHETPRR